MKRKKIKTICIVLASVLAVAVIVLILWPHNVTQAKTTALSVDGYDMDTETFNYFYRDCYDSFLNAYGDMVLAQGLIQSGESLAEQQYSEDLAWADFFYETAAGNATRSLIVYLAAEEAGFELPEEAVAEINTKLETIKANAKEFSYANAEEFLQSHYGPGASMGSYEDYLIFSAMADQYSGNYYQNIECSEEEMKDWFAQNYPDAGDKYGYNTIDFRMIYIPFTDYAFDEASMGFAYSKENQEAVLSQIQEIYGLYTDAEMTEEHFTELAGEYSYYNGEDGGFYENALEDDSNVEQQVRTWLFRDGHQYGDVEIIEADSGDYLVYWIGEGMPAWEYLAQQGIKLETWNAWYESLTEGAEVTENQDVLKNIYLIA